MHNAIQSTARLEIHEVVAGPAATEADALQTLGGSLPPDDMIVKGANSVTAAGNSDMFYVLKRVAIVSGTDFRGAQPVRDPNTGQSQTSFNLTSGAGERFYEFTSANVGKGIAVVLENRVRSVASIKSAIHDSGVIEGLSEDEAKNLSLMLRTGSLPASISYLDTLTVGPSLGAASITHGVYAAVAGMLAVMFFMLLYYRGAGINADLALVLNLVILLGFMGLTGSTLTLPGIAGVILTIGMGVDSNVLIFERIREELHLGRTPSAAVQNGFAHAWVTIIDTHVTTIVSAAILFLFGTGPVRGFAVTLTFGLLANIFTAVFVSRTIFDAILNRKQRGEALSI
ncbi:protein translocase subunit SecD [Terriglobus sp. YAF25]|uniref:protein translocase subunit SecD n=1 Tax=Terriglobus sp. YAF25 TaxID=3233080 RepID=UPI003F9908F4